MTGTGKGERAMCAVCGRVYAVRNDGTLRHHNFGQEPARYGGMKLKLCPGAYKPAPTSEDEWLDVPGGRVRAATTGPDASEEE
jgi:hypothetical protein